jgi:predicted membrane channel-forming protein YqfA (hemolysin III family)
MFTANKPTRSPSSSLLSSLLSPSATVSMKSDLEGSSKSERGDDCYFYTFPFIEYGYRRNHTRWELFTSLLTFHNESANIWTHLIGFICISLTGINALVDSLYGDGDGNFEFESNGSWGTFFFQLYILCAAICLGLSATYHWFGCFSEAYHRNLLRLDLTGVGLLVAGSFFPGSYYGFYCLPHLQTRYLWLSLVVLIIGLIAPWVEIKFGAGWYIRPYIFAGLVVLGLVPMTHWAMITPPMFAKKLLLVSEYMSRLTSFSLHSRKYLWSPKFR